MIRVSRLPLLSALLFNIVILAPAQVTTKTLSYSSLDKITPTKDFFFFVLNDDLHGVELWRSDGSTGGTQIVKDINDGSHSSSPDHLVLMDSILYFTADDGVHGEALWRSDGTSKGTRLLKDFSTTTSNVFIKSISRCNHNMMIECQTELDDIEYWNCDGTTSGTILVGYSSEQDNDVRKRFDISDLIFSSHKKSAREIDHENFCRIDNKIYFVATDSKTGRELWQSDGTKEGTFIVKDIHPGQQESFITGMRSLKGILYFSSNDGQTGNELWKSNGEEHGTVLVKDIVPGIDSSHPRNFTCFGDKVVFSVFGTESIELWMTDGSTNGTVKIFPALAESSTAPLLLPKHDELSTSRKFSTEITSQ